MMEIFGYNEKQTIYIEGIITGIVLMFLVTIVMISGIHIFFGV